MIQAVIFDMDGTMVDTETLWGDVTRRLAETYGITWDESVRVKMMGKKDSEALTIMQDFFQIPASVSELVAARRSMILEDLSMIKVKEGLYELLDLLDKKNIKKAVATASFAEFAAQVLQRFDLASRFDAIVTGDDVLASKPDPTIFLKAAKLVGVDPYHCLVIEDAQNGVEGARNAGMFCFAIPHGSSMHHDFSKATRVIGSMLEINEDSLASL